MTFQDEKFSQNASRVDLLRRGQSKWHARQDRPTSCYLFLFLVGVLKFWRVQSLLKDHFSCWWRDSVPGVGMVQSGLCSETHWISKSPCPPPPPSLLPPGPLPPAVSSLKEGPWPYPLSHQGWIGKAERWGGRRSSPRPLLSAQSPQSRAAADGQLPGLVTTFWAWSSGGSCP